MKSLSVTIQIKATEQYFPVVLYKVVLTFKSVDKSYSVAIQMNTVQQYLPLRLRT